MFTLAKLISEATKNQGSEREENHDKCIYPNKSNSQCIYASNSLLLFFRRRENICVCDMNIICWRLFPFGFIMNVYTYIVNKANPVTINDKTAMMSAAF